MILIPYRSADTGEDYTLAVYLSGEIACTCGDFTYRQSLGRTECKHIRQWKADNIPAGAARAGWVVTEPSKFY